MLPPTAPRLLGAPPPALVAAARTLLSALSAGHTPLAYALGQQVLARFPAFAPAFAESAAWLGVSAELLAAATLSYDHTVSFGCSTLALATPTGPLIARNMDWHPEDLLARASAIQPVAAGWSAGVVGSVGVFSGLAPRFAVVLNAVLTERPEPDGFPVLLFLRHLISTARDFATAVQMAVRTPLMSGALLTLVGLTNDERIVIERTPDRAAVRTVDDAEPLITTNHYRALAEPIDAGCGRFCRLQELAVRLPAQPSASELVTCLADSAVWQTITAQQVILQPATGQIEMYLPAHLLR
jgi:hypothetical protein